MSTKTCSATEIHLCVCVCVCVYACSRTTGSRWVPAIYCEFHSCCTFLIPALSVRKRRPGEVNLLKVTELEFELGSILF